MKTLNDFKQEVAIENYYQNWSHLNEYETSYAVLDFSDQAAERYAEYRAKEVLFDRVWQLEKAEKRGWNEALDWAAEQCDFKPDKTHILKGLK